MEGRDDGAESLEPNSSSFKSLSVTHLKSIHKYSAVSVRVNLEFHSDRPVITVFDAFHRFVGNHTLSIFLEDRLVLGGLDSCSRVPAEFIA